MSRAIASHLDASRALIARMAKALREGRGVRLSVDDLRTLEIIGWVQREDTEASLLEDAPPCEFPADYFEQP